MTRARSGIIHARRRRKILNMTKGYMGARHRLFRTAKDAIRKSLQHAFNDRKRKKRVFRALWIVRLNAACRAQGISYSQFIYGLKKKGIELDRKFLSQIAITDKDSFSQLVSQAKSA